MRCGGACGARSRSWRGLALGQSVDLVIEEQDLEADVAPQPSLLGRRQDAVGDDVADQHAGPGVNEVQIERAEKETNIVIKEA